MPRKPKPKPTAAPCPPMPDPGPRKLPVEYREGDAVSMDGRPTAPSDVPENRRPAYWPALPKDHGDGVHDLEIKAFDDTVTITYHDLAYFVDHIVGRIRNRLEERLHEARVQRKVPGLEDGRIAEEVDAAVEQVWDAKSTGDPVLALNHVANNNTFVVAQFLHELLATHCGSIERMQEKMEESEDTLAADGRAMAEAVNGMDALSLQQWATDFAATIRQINRDHILAAIGREACR
jgi:hypothetical protein